MKDKRALEADGEALELKVQRQIEEERAAIVCSTTERVEESLQLKLREKDLTLEQMRKRIDELQAAADQKRSGLPCWSIVFELQRTGNDAPGRVARGRSIVP